MWEELKNEEELGLVWFGFRLRFDSGWRCVGDGEKAMHRSYGVSLSRGRDFVNASISERTKMECPFTPPVCCAPKF